MRIWRACEPASEPARGSDQSVLPHHPRGRRALGVGLGALAMTIGFSRIYVGVHWATDVLGGLALGLAIACLVHLVLVTAYTKNQKS